MAQPIRRRTLLGGTAGIAAVAGVTALVADAESQAPAPVAQRLPTPPGPRGVDAVATTEWVRSQARHRPVRLVLVAPAGLDRTTLPVCLGLHGLRGNASFYADSGMRRGLGTAWAGGVPPFVVAAVDGGDNYWHPYRPDDDPGRMILEELPRWLAERGINRATPDGPGVPSLVTGFSMGGAGALMYARERARRGARVRAAAAISPGLFTDWRVASRRPFAGISDWAANDPLRFYPELATTPTGIWVGDRDTFVEATRRYLVLARPAVGSVTPGRHDGTFYASVLPAMMRFLGAQLTSAATGARAVATPA